MLLHVVLTEHFLVLAVPETTAAFWIGLNNSSGQGSKIMEGAISEGELKSEQVEASSRRELQPGKLWRRQAETALLTGVRPAFI